MTLRRTLILTLLPTAVKLTVWYLLRKAIQKSLEERDERIQCRVREEQIEYAKWMKDQGDSDAMIAERLGITEASAQALLA